MTRRRIKPDPGLLLAATGGVVLIPLLFASWFCLPAASLATEGAVAVSPERCWNAWTSFAMIDLLLFLTGLMAVVAFVLAVRRIALPLRPGPLLAVIGGVCFLLVFYRMVSPPWAGAGLATAPFFALLCLALIGGGGMLSARIGSTSDSRARAGRPAGPGRATRGGARRRPAEARRDAARSSSGDHNGTREMR